MFVKPYLGLWEENKLFIFTRTILVLEQLKKSVLYTNR